jgi:hypothetical protein
MHINERLDDHQKFKELAVLAQRGAISDVERIELRDHLRDCRACRQVCDEYLLITKSGMPFLAAAFGQNREVAEWDEQPARDRLMARVRRSETWPPPPAHPAIGIEEHLAFDSKPLISRWGFVAVAGCVLLLAAAGAYLMSAHPELAKPHAFVATAPVAADAANDKQEREKDLLIGAQKHELERLRAELRQKQQEVTRLEQGLQTAGDRSTATAAADMKTEQRVHDLVAERDRLAGELRDAEQSYQLLQAELTTLSAEHEKTLIRTTSLQTKVDELEASTRDEERKLKDDEQYLSSDRDIRELMGARKLYIADVFDVDSGSRTRKPFGRVFYTQNKSLIFYAFDLDHQPGVKNANAFQVWGQRDGAEEQSHATNLGILYMDSESNRRWVLKIDDPKQLAEIDAVFVTIEPNGGSQKPTGKPFLYALLRREANHP